MHAWVFLLISKGFQSIAEQTCSADREVMRWEYPIRIECKDAHKDKDSRALYGVVMSMLDFCSVYTPCTEMELGEPGTPVLVIPGGPNNQTFFIFPVAG